MFKEVKAVCSWCSPLEKAALLTLSSQHVAAPGHTGAAAGHLQPPAVSLVLITGMVTVLVHQVWLESLLLPQCGHPWHLLLLLPLPIPLLRPQTGVSVPRVQQRCTGTHVVDLDIFTPTFSTPLTFQPLCESFKQITYKLFNILANII